MVSVKFLTGNCSAIFGRTLPCLSAPRLRSYQSAQRAPMCENELGIDTDWGCLAIFFNVVWEYIHPCVLFPEVQNDNTCKRKFSPNVKHLPRAHSVTEVLIPQGSFRQGSKQTIILQTKQIQRSLFCQGFSGGTGYEEKDVLSSQLICYQRPFLHLPYQS